MLIALQGIQRAKAKGSTDAVLGLFEGLTKDPSKDKGKAEGEIRKELAEWRTARDIQGTEHEAALQ